MARFARGGGQISNAFKMGIGAAAGFAVVNVGLLLLALAFLIPGAILLARERKKPDGERNVGLPYALIAIGVLLGGGLGINFLLGGLTQDAV